MPGWSSSDAAGATAVLDNCDGARTALPVPRGMGRLVLRQRVVRCEECRRVWRFLNLERWRAYWIDDGPAVGVPRVSSSWRDASPGTGRVGIDTLARDHELASPCRPPSSQWSPDTIAAGIDSRAIIAHSHEQRAEGWETVTGTVGLRPPNLRVSLGEGRWLTSAPRLSAELVEAARGWNAFGPWQLVARLDVLVLGYPSTRSHWKRRARARKALVGAGQARSANPELIEQDRA